MRSKVEEALPRSRTRCRWRPGEGSGATKPEEGAEDGHHQDHRKRCPAAVRLGAAKTASPTCSVESHRRACLPRVGLGVGVWSAIGKLGRRFEAGPIETDGSLGTMHREARVVHASPCREVTGLAWQTFYADTARRTFAGLPVATAGRAGHAAARIRDALSSNTDLSGQALIVAADLETLSIGAPLGGPAVSVGTGVIHAPTVATHLPFRAAQHSAGGWPAPPAGADEARVAEHAFTEIHTLPGRGITPLAVATVHPSTEVAHASPRDAPQTFGARGVVVARESAHAVELVAFAALGAGRVLVGLTVAVVVEAVTELGA